MEIKRYLFLFTVGPVHSFIEQARKLRDLYAGSRMLIDLTESGIKTVLSYGNARIIFPYFKADDKEVNFPNRFVAEIETEDIQAIGRAAEETVRERFIHMLPKSLKNSPDRAAYEKQLQDYLQIYWSAVEYDGVHYKETYEELESLMGGIKNVRYFSQDKNAPGAEVKNCSLCGMRLAVEDALIDKQKKNYQLKKGEHLCALCAAKRQRQQVENGSFPSIATVSGYHWISKLKGKAGGEKRWAEYCKLFDGYFSDEYIYPENITLQAIKKEPFSQKHKEIERANRELRALMKDTVPLRKYYALVAFDGDSMGKWLSGTFFKEGTDFFKLQRNLSQALGDYARWVKGHLTRSDKPREDQQPGVVIYAGGEDFLGMIPLEDLFSVLKVLREKFREMVNDRLQDSAVQELSFSAGVCIAHYKAPLDLVFEEAKKMESAAKDFRETKNAVAFSLMKRSGEIHQAILPWKDDEGHYLIDTLEAISQSFAANDFSDAFLRNLSAEMREFYNPGDFDMREQQELFISESSHFIARACLEADAGKRREKISRMQARIAGLYRVVANTACKQPAKRFEYYMMALSIAEFLGREPVE